MQFLPLPLLLCVLPWLAGDAVLIAPVSRQIAC
jgi:hypothetical protein